nr:hypothetical protein [Lachnospiraceae bacterium]
MTEVVNDQNMVSEQTVVIDGGWIQAVQDCYAEMSGLFIYLMDKDGRNITQMSGDAVEMSRIRAAVPKKQIDDIFERVMHGNTEEQIVEDTEYSNVKVASIAI